MVRFYGVNPLCSVVLDYTKVKVVGKRNVPATPEEYVRRAWRLQQQANRLNPNPRPRGFVYKAKTWRDYESWRSRQANPRLW